MVTAQDVRAADVERVRLPGSTRSLLALTVLLVGMAVFTGGGSRDRGWGDALTQLLAWPVLLLAVWNLAGVEDGRKRLWLVGVAMLLPLGIALQWIAGITLTPWATERAIWSVLPAVAAFAAVLALPRQSRAVAAWAVVALATFSLLLGYLQLGAPQDSLLNPFPEWPPALNGLYANPNHQATSIAVALVLVLAWLLHRQPVPAEGAGSWWATRVAMGGVALFLLVGLPLTGSRAAVLIAAAAIIAIPVANGWLRRRLRHGRRLALVAMIGGAIAGAFLLVSASAWLKVDQQQESRTAVYAATSRMALETLPAGTGVGSFVPWFEAHAPDSLVRRTYFNHAHSEYLQWWLEGGVLGLAWIALLLAFAVWARPRTGPDRPDWLAVGAWVGVVLILAHSAVDYPLRTPAMMTVAALLAGIAAAGRLDTREAQTP